MQKQYVSLCFVYLYMHTHVYNCGLLLSEDVHVSLPFILVVKKVP